MAEPTIRQIGRYQLLDVIGQGGMGIVYRAVDASIGRTVAIKMLHGAYAEDKDLLARFHREVRSTANLQHKNIVTVYALDDFEGFPYMVMEYLEGQSIAEMITSRRPLRLVERIGLVCQVCEGLQYAHERNVIHRDIKPANILVLKDGVAKIVDFGIARVGMSETLTRTGQIIGSMYYMSPEQIGGVAVDARTDIYSAGVMLYQFLTGELPFKADDPNATFYKILNEPIPSVGKYIAQEAEIVDGILAKAMAKRVEERYQSAEEFGFELLSLHDRLKRGMTAEFLAQARSAVDRRDWEAARQQLQELLRLDRRNDQANELFQFVRQEIQRQQRSVQIEQLRSQAQIARAGLEYKEALECIEQALRLNPGDGELSALLKTVKGEAERAQGLIDALRRGQAAFYAGDLNEAELAVREALDIEADHTEARTLENLIQKELAERTRRAQLQGLVEDARREISGNNFMSALRSLQKAQAIDPSDSNVRELIAWASRGHEQEKLREEIQRATNEIGQLLGRDCYAEAFESCNIALQRFPEEPSLFKLQLLAKRQLDLMARRRTIDELSTEVRRLADAGQDEEAVALLETALQSYPGERNLETLLAINRAEVERKREEQLERERHQENIDALEDLANSAVGAQGQVLGLVQSFQEGLTRKQSLSHLRSLKDRLAIAVKEFPLSGGPASSYSNALLEFETRCAKWDRDSQELEALYKLLSEANSSTEVLSYLERARIISEQNGKDEEIKAKSQWILEFAQGFKRRREVVVGQVASLVESMQSTQDLPSLIETEKEIERASEFWLEDASIQVLIDQASSYVESIRKGKQKVLQELAEVTERLSSARSAGVISLHAGQAQMLASDRLDDPDIAAAFRQIEKFADDLSRRLETSSSAIRDLTTKIASATSLEEIEASRRKAVEASAKLLDFEETIDLLRKVDRRADERRKDRERVCQNLNSLSISAANARGLAELQAIRLRCNELIREWTGDIGVALLVRTLEEASQDREAELVEIASAAEGEELNLDDQKSSSESGSPVQHANSGATSLFSGTKSTQSDASQDRLTSQSQYLRLSALLALPALLAIGLASLSFVPKSVQFTGPSGATITVDGKYCQAPCSLSLARGKHIVVAKLDGYEDLSQSIAVSIFGDNKASLNMKETATRELVKNPPSSANAVLDNPVPNNSVPPLSTPQLPVHQDRSGAKGLAPSTGSIKNKPENTRSSPAGSREKVAKEVVPPPPSPGATPIDTKPVVTQPPTVDFNATEQKIQQGQTVTLNWMAQNSSAVEIDNGIGAVNAAGSAQVRPQQSTTYKIVAKNSAGGSATERLQIDVVPPPAPPSSAIQVDNELAAAKMALDRYQEAYDNESLDDMKQAWPGMSRSEQKVKKQTFDLFNAIHMKLNCPDDAFHFEGTIATVSCKVTATYTQNGKKQPGQTNLTQFKLKKQGKTWVIDSVR